MFIKLNFFEAVKFRAYCPFIFIILTNVIYKIFKVGYN